MLNRAHLEILRALRDEGSISEAASTLHLTQSALSHSIRKLEHYLGVKLWLRQGRALRLTRAGGILLSLADRTLPDFEHAEQLIGKLASGEQGLLRIGMECHPCYEWLHRSIAPFIAAFEGVDIDVKRQFQFDGLTALLNHDIDVLITPDPVFKPRLKFVPVFSYELVLVCAQAQGFGERRYIDAPTLAQQVLYTYPVAKERLDVFSQFLLPAQLEPREHKTVESTDIMLQMVAARRGVTALPSWLVEQYKSTLRLRSYRLGRGGIHKQIYLGVRVEDQQVPYIKGFIKLAKETGVEEA
ncbi:MAG: LysR family transcriptional regulator [Pseudomonadales bacterium]|jgi:LysR family transcriptional regulator for metE and metH|nr:LysR family transcriptional regulator [Pseudomonadales bacterium]